MSLPVAILRKFLGQTALHIATEEGLDTVCSRILDKTEDKNPKDNLNNTPLHIAAKAGNMVLVKRILMKSGESSNFVHIKFGAYSMISIKSTVHLACGAKILLININKTEIKTVHST